jgi:hypothetical protein
VDLYIHSPIRLHGVMLNQLSTGTTLTFFTFTRMLLSKMVRRKITIWTVILVGHLSPLTKLRYYYTTECIA